LPFRILVGAETQLKKRAVAMKARKIIIKRQQKPVGCSQVEKSCSKSGLKKTNTNKSKVQTPELKREVVVEI
jgi:hypothetical protein